MPKPPIEWPVVIIGAIATYIVLSAMFGWIKI